MDTKMHLNILKLPEVMKRTGLSSSSIYRLMAEECFPCQIKLSLRSVGWLEHEIDEWIIERKKCCHT